MQKETTKNFPLTSKENRELEKKSYIPPVILPLLDNSIDSHFGIGSDGNPGSSRAS